MRRRECIAMIGAAAAWPFTARAQQVGKVYRVAWVHPSTPVADLSENSGIRHHRALIEELRRLGYVEGRNLIFERYSGEGRTEHYGELAEKVVRTKPDLILTHATPMVRAFKSATAIIPIIAFTADPVANGITTNLARPEGNNTGVVTDAGIEIWGKRLALLLETIPTLSKVGFIIRRGDHVVAAAGREAAQKIGMSVFEAPLEGAIQETEYRRVFDAMQQQKVGALVVADNVENFTNRRLIVELAEKAKLPAIYPFREPVELGGLMAYAYDLPDGYRYAAHQIDKILKGAKPQDIPFYQPVKFDLILNLKAAKSLGLTFPPRLLATASEVIE
jgi:putative ABC transport system substrate-binding protein